jgi:hypothetical protein
LNKTDRLYVELTDLDRICFYCPLPDCCPAHSACPFNNCRHTETEHGWGWLRERARQADASFTVVFPEYYIAALARNSLGKDRRLWNERRISTFTETLPDKSVILHINFGKEARTIEDPVRSSQ